MLQGWIKLHRKLSDKSFFKKDSEKVHLWILLLLKANFTEKEECLGGKPFLCKPGQFTTGRRQLAEESGISESKIERILTYFEKIEQQIEQRKMSTNRLITILNWEECQQIEQQIEQQVNNDRTATEQRLNTLKECKECKEIKEIKEIKTPLENKIDDFIIHRKELKKPLDAYKLGLIIKKLNKLASDDDDKINILQQSIDEGWHGVFELKKKTKATAMSMQEFHEYLTKGLEE